jgi:hypothetical protein
MSEDLKYFGNPLVNSNWPASKATKIAEVLP